MKRFYLFALVAALMIGGVASAQFPILDMLADKVIQKYQQSTCEQLWQKKGPAETADGTESHPDAAQRAANAPRFHQQSSSTYPPTRCSNAG